jgi:acyl-CoA oxidase
MPDTPATIRALRNSIHPLVPTPTAQRIRELFSAPTFAARRDLTREETTRLVYDQLRAINAEFGPGSDLLAEPSRLFALFSWAGLADPALVFVMLVHYCLALASIVDLGGTGEVPAGRVRELDELSSFGSFLITEPRRGSSHIATRTQARYDPERDEFVLHTPSPVAAKLASAAHPGLPKLGVVLARLEVAGRDRGVFAFAVPLRDERGPRPGVKIDPLPGMPLLAADSCLVTFDHVRVPRGDWLAGGATIDADGTTFHDVCADADSRLVRTIAAGSYCWSAQSVALAAAARGCVTIALRYASQRTTMGRQTPRLPAIAHRNQHRPLLGALAKAYAITFLANEAALADAPNQDNQRSLGGAATPWSSINRSSALTKALVARGLEDVADRSRRSYGALGLVTANRVLDYQMLGHAFHAAGGDGQLILLDTARALVAGPGPKPLEDGVEPGSLLDPAYLQSLAEAREHRAHQDAAWNEQYDSYLELANAHAAALTLAAGLRAASKTADPAASQRLMDLCLLNALESVHESSGWLLANKLLTPAQVLEIPEAMNALCDRLLPQVATLLNAFDIPESLLGLHFIPLARNIRS